MRSLRTALLVAAIIILPAEQAFNSILFREKHVPYYCGNRERSEIAITFDDGPCPGSTELILYWADYYGIKLTFFMTGENARRNSRLVREILRKSHEIGVHTNTHPLMSGLAYEAQEGEIRSCLVELASCGNVLPKIFRPPYGNWNEATLEAADESGLATILWDVSSDDWQASATPQKITENLLAACRNGSLLLLHDGDEDGNARPATLEAVPLIFATLAKSYKTVTVSELLEGETHED